MSCFNGWQCAHLQTRDIAEEERCDNGRRKKTVSDTDIYLVSNFFVTVNNAVMNIRAHKPIHTSLIISLR